MKTSLAAESLVEVGKPSEGPNPPELISKSTTRKLERELSLIGISGPENKPNELKGDRQRRKSGYNCVAMWSENGSWAVARGVQINH
jgi:hypothetical protein